MTLYRDSISGNCLKTKWTADYLDVDYDWIEVSVVEGGTRSDAFMSMNPSGQVPVMRLPDGRILPQSNAIMLYSRRRQDRTIDPDADPLERAQMFSWLFWEQYSHEPYIAVRRFRKKFMNQTDDELDPQLLARGRRALGVMELQLTFSNYFVGENMTLARHRAGRLYALADEGGFDLSEFPKVQRWVMRVEADLGIEHARKPPRAMYRYYEFDETLVRVRAAQFRGQVNRRLAGQLKEEHFKPLRRLQGSVYLQLHAYMFRIAIPYGQLSAKPRYCGWR